MKVPFFWHESYGMRIVSQCELLPTYIESTADDFEYTKRT